MQELAKNEKYITVKDKNGKDIKRIGKLIKVDKYTKSKYKYKVKIAPKNYIWLTKF